FPDAWLAAQQDQFTLARFGALPPVEHNRELQLTANHGSWQAAGRRFEPSLGQAWGECFPGAHSLSHTFQDLRPDVAILQRASGQLSGVLAQNDGIGSRQPLQSGCHIRRITQRELLLRAAGSDVADDHQSRMDSDPHAEASRLDLEARYRVN